ncbi:alpha/beta-hydrolase [Penicillium cinerascens]|uniref:Alpha/beta-hydrolase n=1 Tax=Penicillium cinerascens TaxID=70096 RepID=A0A9W9TE95_9EURO|nr:alpha/beta-hydrolase [Penicillium cinerascens]KAJ5219468.1 alpha/beta-hydrolase [Penicillium cinerascens]
MSSSWIHTLASSLLLTMMVIRTAIAKENFKLRPFEIDLSDRVPRMIRQIQESHLPQTPVYTDTGTSAGITLSDLKSFKQQWLTSFDWNQEQTSLNKYWTMRNYATFGTDWGSGVAYTLYDQWNTTVRAAHLDFLPFYPLSAIELAAENITLTGLEDFEEDVTITWSNSGTGYFSEQTTKVSEILPSYPKVHMGGND